MITAEAGSVTKGSVSSLIRRDADLASGLVPETKTLGSGNTFFVTGSTGFLGRFLVKELLSRPEATVYCLVRGTDQADARNRLAASLASVEVDLFSPDNRIRVIVGDIHQTRLGLSDQEYREAARCTGGVYHCAAEVNWTQSYRHLRKCNVLGTLELIRFACSGPLKRIYFSSTIGVCFAQPGPANVYEKTDMLPYVDHMPLAYAQSKCVAESLLRTVSARGVPVSVVRPALISGDSDSGVSNPDDLISALLAGCVASGSASDSDWQLDCVPVDHVARLLACLGDSERPQWDVLNLFNQQGRHWREIVLWMNLNGYRVQLVPHKEWLRKSFHRDSVSSNLYKYRRFFGATRSAAQGSPPYAVYLEPAQERVQNEATQRILETLGIRTPPLDAPLLERYFDHYADIGVLPGMRSTPHGCDHSDRARQTLEEAIRPRCTEQNLDILGIVERPFSSRNGIFNEISAARVGGYIGIRRYDAVVRESGAREPKVLSVLMKSKPSDDLMENLLVEVASLCDPELGAHCEAVKSDLGLANCHERELGLFELTEYKLRQHMPTVFGTHRDLEHGVWSVAMEYLVDAEKVDMSAMEWKPREVSAALRGLASMHATWYGRDTEVSAIPWITQPPEADRMVEMTHFWRSLAKFSGTYFSSWLGPTIMPLQRSFIANLEEWWPILRSLPKTLIHNDCNPRNLVLHKSSTGIMPILFDWELATVHVPQHDIAELLCFVLPSDCCRSMLSGFLETHRRNLQDSAGLEVDFQQYLRGFILSLRYLLINRLALYTLMHRFRRQPFLPKVMRNWRVILELSNELVSSRDAPAFD